MKVLILAPLHVEALALRGGARVLRTGMGPERARIAAARAQAIEADVVVVAGVCAGVDPALRTGDLVCPTELRREDGTVVAVPEAAALAQRLDARTGALLSLDRLAGAAERGRLEDVLAVDMESAWLAEAAAGRPFAVVRAVADASGRRLWDPRLAADGLRALAALRRALPALEAWSPTASPVVDTVAV